jgi:hypothetical protein
MTALTVIKNFDVFEDGALCLFSIREGLQVNQFRFQAVEEALGDGVDAPMSNFSPIGRI